MLKVDDVLLCACVCINLFSFKLSLSVLIEMWNRRNIVNVFTLNILLCRKEVIPSVTFMILYNCLLICAICLKM